MSPDEALFDGGLAPTVCRRILAARLRRLRRQAGLTLDDVARLLQVSSSKVSRLENEEREPRVDDVRQLAEIYELDPDEAAELVDLAQGAGQRSVWRSFLATAPHTGYFELESTASSVRGFESSHVHGLLQTRAYTEALLAPLDLGPIETAAETREQIIGARALRQRRLLSPDDLQLHVVMGEVALKSMAGSAEVMRAQLTHLLELSERPNVTLQVWPFSSGPASGFPTSFVILEFPLPELDDVVYVELLTGEVIIDRVAEVTEYQHGFNETAMKALTPEDSQALLESNRKWWIAAD